MNLYKLKERLNKICKGDIDPMKETHLKVVVAYNGQEYDVDEICLQDDKLVISLDEGIKKWMPVHKQKMTKGSYPVY